jgi:hypothetical protein
VGLAEIDDVRVFRAGPLLVLGNFSKVATDNDDYAGRLAKVRSGDFEFMITPFVRLKESSVSAFRRSPGWRTPSIG